MSGSGHRPGLLLLAHGERIDDPANEGVRHLLVELRRKQIAPKIEAGLLSGIPDIGQAVAAFGPADFLVYPLFMSDGYFLRKATAALRAAAEKQGARPYFTILPPFGVDPGLADLIAVRAHAMARVQGWAVPRTALVLVAHGSLRETASQRATDVLVQRLQRLGAFSGSFAAFLDQPPSFSEVLAGVGGPCVVVGMFMGNGLHGGVDLDALLGAADRSVAAFAGNVGTWPEIADLIAASVMRESRP